ncbi:predicted protein [Plenodomus lingam JN3]|uniref:Predicted protein n=1 Tax=Leptosphaeria maculans (strain JN3 / isolate v23.1.3 / race Av1-4-5-6-7-8) TaxID=985895 RepID=E4ZU69_LEPMJ|nr:predicted protein [Plenodomus lingam JN3]CBX94948.1 predicted protein [Plenodomus lingam JN3]
MDPCSRRADESASIRRSEDALGSVKGQAVAVYFSSPRPAPSPFTPSPVLQL